MLILILLLSCLFNVSNSINSTNTCIQILTSIVKFYSLDNTWAELLPRDALNLYKIGNYNQTVIAVFDSFSRQYGYIIIDDPNDIFEYEWDHCTHQFNISTNFPQPSHIYVTDYTGITDGYNIIVSHDHILYEMNDTDIYPVDKILNYNNLYDENIRVAYGIVSTERITKGVYLPVCTFIYRRVYIYLNSFMTYRFEPNNEPTEICIHGNRHDDRRLIDEYTNKININNDITVVHQKCMIPTFSNSYGYHKILNQDTCNDNATSVITIISGPFIIPQNYDYHRELPDVTAICISGDCKLC